MVYYKTSNIIKFYLVIYQCSKIKIINKKYIYFFLINTKYLFISSNRCSFNPRSGRGSQGRIMQIFISCWWITRLSEVGSFTSSRRRLSCHWALFFASKRWIRFNSFSFSLMVMMSFFRLAEFSNLNFLFSAVSSFFEFLFFMRTECICFGFINLVQSIAIERIRTLTNQNIIELFILINYYSSYFLNIKSDI